MHRLLALALVCTASTVATPAAADGVYFTESFGGTDVKDELAGEIDSAVRIRLGLGVRRGAWAVDAWIAGDIGASGPKREGYIESYPATLTTYGLDLRRIMPISDHVEVYLRGGLSRGHLDGGDHDGYAGRGLGIGAGAQLKGKVRALGFLAWPLFFTGIGPKVTAALFVDTGYDFYRLHRGGDLDDGNAIDAQLSRFTAGFAVGSDF